MLAQRTFREVLFHKSHFTFIFLTLALCAGCGGSGSSQKPSANTPSTLALATTSLPGGTVGATYSFNLSASGGTAPYSWSVISGKLPAGLSLNAAGEISGTPTSAANVDFKIQVKDSSASPQTASAAETIVVGTAGGSLTITTGQLPDATVGSSYSSTLTATGGTPPYTWSLASGQLPAGLALSPAGQITGTPTSTGNSGFTLAVKDSAGSAQTATAARTINADAASLAAALSVQVSGDHLINQNGQTIHLIGFGHQGSEYMCLSSNQAFDDPNSLTTTPENMKSWGAGVNIARIPLNEDCWLGINGVAHGGSAYQSDIMSFVNNLHKSGMYAELELHWNAPGGSQAGDQQVMADFDHSIAFWQSVANAFKNDQAVTFNLYNEPHDVSWTCWKNGGSSCVFGFRIAGMDEMIQAIRTAEGSGWHHPIVVAGLGWSNDLSGWLANRPADTANQIIAGIHTYDDGAGGSNGCPADPGAPWNENNCASNIFGAIKAAGIPLVVTEMGDLSAGGCTYSTFLDSAFKWLDANADGYEPWAWGPFGCGNPSLVSDWNGTPVSTYGTGVKAHIMTLPTTY